MFLVESANSFFSFFFWSDHKPTLIFRVVAFISSQMITGQWIHNIYHFSKTWLSLESNAKRKMKLSSKMHVLIHVLGIFFSLLIRVCLLALVLYFSSAYFYVSIHRVHLSPLILWSIHKSHAKTHVPIYKYIRKCINHGMFVHTKEAIASISLTTIYNCTDNPDRNVLSAFCVIWI